MEDEFDAAALTQEFTNYCVTRGYRNLVMVYNLIVSAIGKDKLKPRDYQVERDEGSIRVYRKVGGWLRKKEVDTLTITMDGENFKEIEWKEDYLANNIMAAIKS